MKLINSYISTISKKSFLILFYILPFSHSFALNQNNKTVSTTHQFESDNNTSTNINTTLHTSTHTSISTRTNARSSIEGEKLAVPGEYLVKLKPQFNVSSINQIMVQDQLSAFIKTQLPNSNLLIVKRASFEKQSSAIYELSKSPLVEFVEPNLIYKSLLTPNDPSFIEQWGLKNLTKSKYAIDIEIEKAWDLQTGSNDIIVAIIDSGINYHNPDLIENIWTNEKEKNGKPGIDDDGNGYIDDLHGINPIEDGSLSNPIDNNGHGTHCAGTIGGKGNNGLGLTGINWNVKLMGLKFLSSEGVGTLEAAVKAIDYAVMMGAKVISNSWGSYETSKALGEAIERAHQAGTLFVAAAGNDGTNNDEKPMFPASYNIPNVLSVAAVGSSGALAGFSNWGLKSVHLGAPGVGVFGFWKEHGETKAPSGTSMAAPFVSGVAALVFAQNPKLSGVEVKDRILKAVKTLPALRGRTSSSGFLNAYYAVNNQTAPPNPDDPENWSSIPLDIETAHPYPANDKQRFEVHIPGASEISIYFSNIDTEKQMDEVKILDKNGKVSHIMSGNRGAVYSRFVQGDTAYIEFKSDSSVESFGFKITKAAYR